MFSVMGCPPSRLKSRVARDMSLSSSRGGRAMAEYGTAFVGIDIAKAKNAISIADEGRQGELWYRPRRRPGDHQPARHRERAALALADAVFRLGSRRHMGALRSRAARGPPAPSLAAGLARRPHEPRQHRRAWRRGPRHVDRGNDGDDVEGRALRSGHCRDRGCGGTPRMRARGRVLGKK